MNHDPLEDFFARERAEIRELPGSPDHWESIVQEARRPARRGWFPYLAVAAAAALVAGALGSGFFNGEPDRQVASVATSRPSTPTPSPTATPPTSTPSPTGSATTAPTPVLLPVPVSFTPRSMTNAGGGRVFALGEATCGAGQPCAAVVGSADDGSSWELLASFRDQTLVGGRTTPDTANALVGVRFANARVGYAYGGRTFRTTDGGRSFQNYDVGGRRVLSLETDGATVWLVTAATCLHQGEPTKRGCSGLELWSAPVSDSAATRVARLDLPEPVESAWLSVDGHDPVVDVAYRDPARTSGPLRVSGRSLAPMSRPAGCADAGALWAWATANEPGALVGVCPAKDRPQEAYAVTTSKDRGATWSTAVPAPDLGRPGATGVWLTATDRAHLTAIPQGLTTSTTTGDAPTTVRSSADGGKTWRMPKVGQDTKAWSWSGAAGGPLVYLLGGPFGTYARSTDSGATFREVPLRK